MGTGKACCFWGHRQRTFSWGYDEEHPDCGELRVHLLREIMKLAYGGVKTYLSGMAAGVDLIAAETVLDLKRAMPERDIRLIVVMSCEEQAAKWNSPLRERYYRVLEYADSAIFISSRYTPTCVAERTQYLIDHATHMVVVCNGEPGGSEGALSMARYKDLKMSIIDVSKFDAPEPQLNT